MQLQRAYKMRKGRMQVRFLEEGKDWRLRGFLYAGNLVLCGEMKVGLIMKMRLFVEVC